MKISRGFIDSAEHAAINGQSAMMLLMRKQAGFTQPGVLAKDQIRHKRSELIFKKLFIKVQKRHNWLVLHDPQPLMIVLDFRM